MINAIATAARNRINASLIALLIVTLPTLAIAQLPYAPPTCIVSAHLLINTYVGPIEITDVCMTTFIYTGGSLEFIGIDLADGIFRAGFDGEGLIR